MWNMFSHSPVLFLELHFPWCKTCAWSLRVWDRAKKCVSHAKSVRVGSPVHNKDHNSCHDTDSFTLLLSSLPLSPSLSLSLSALVLVCPPSLRHAAVPVERLMHGYNVLHCALWRLALLFTRNLRRAPICFSPSLSRFHFFLSSIFYPFFIILTPFFKTELGKLVDQ